jgi:hypothetical protein
VTDDVELMLDREQAGREASPTAAVMDSQSVKAPGAATRGYDAGKRIFSRKGPFEEPVCRARLPRLRGAAGKDFENRSRAVSWP